MIYTDLTKKAIKIAFVAHAGQLDRSGMPYILHPIHVAEQMKDEDTCVAALLHDVVEDTDITIEELRGYGFTEEQLEAVRLLTRLEEVDYLDYVRNLRDNPIAKAVKIEDLKHNSDVTRMETLSEDDRERFEKYKKAMEILVG